MSEAEKAFEKYKEEDESVLTCCSHPINGQYCSPNPHCKRADKMFYAGYAAVLDVIIDIIKNS